MRWFLEVTRIGFVQEARVDPGDPPALAPPELQCVELHAAHQEPDRVTHDLVLGREARGKVDGDRAPSWATSDGRRGSRAESKVVSGGGSTGCYALRPTFSSDVWRTTSHH